MRRSLPWLLLLAWAAPARAQTMLDQEERLIEIHSLLVALPPLAPPAPYRAGEGSLGLEVVAIPTIDGTTGGKRQITASDRTRAFPRPRLALGLPAPEGFRAFAGIGYIPPIAINGVSSHLGAFEAGIAWAPAALSVGVRGHAVYATSLAPVTDPATRDTLRTFEGGADASAGYRLDLGRGWSATPYGGVGVARVVGDFRVTSDGVKLSSRTTDLSLTAGVRLFGGPRLEAVAELVAFPGRLVHPSFRVGWVPDWGTRSP